MGKGRRGGNEMSMRGPRLEGGGNMSLFSMALATTEYFALCAEALRTGWPAKSQSTAGNTKR